MIKLKTYIYSFLAIIIFTGTVLFDNSVRAEPPIPGEEITAIYLDEVYLTVPDVHRTGAKCCDGTDSNAKGRGACSHHGGVKYWKYSDGSTESTGRCD